MISTLRDLRDALDQALEALEPLAPVLAAWEASRNAVQEPSERAPEPVEPPVPEVPAASGEAPAPTVGLFDPLPAPARRLAKNGSTTTSCERCGNPVQQQPRGARRKFCSDDCRLRTKTERTARREADPGLELLPDRVERPFSAFAHPDDDRSDPALLRPPPMSWEREGGAGRGRPIRGLHGPARVA